MAKEISKNSLSVFEQIKHTNENGNEFWMARQLSKVQHNTYLAAAKNTSVRDELDYAIFQNHVYMGLYDGLDAKSIHKKKNLKKSQNILDRMGSAQLAAKLFRATQTEEKLCNNNIKGKQKANQTHLEVGRKVYQTIKEISRTMPENLTVADSININEKKLA